MVRRFVAPLAAVLLFVLHAPPSRAVAPTARELAPGTRLLPGRFVEGEQPDGNTAIIEAPQGLIVIDTGRHPEHTDAVIESARASGKQVRVVLNTHWHLDHTGGNARLRRDFPGLRILGTGAFQGAMDGFLATYHKWLEGEVTRLAEDAAARAPLEGELAILEEGAALLPDEVITKSGTRALAGHKLELGVTGRAVTAADLWVFDPVTRILFAGDLVTMPAPLLDTACPEGWRATLDRLADVDFALLVPGHGEPMDRAAFETWRTAYGDLLACAATDTTGDACIEGWMRTLGDRIPESDRHLARTLLDYSIGTLLRGDPGRLAKLCAE